MSSSQKNSNKNLDNKKDKEKDKKPITKKNSIKSNNDSNDSSSSKETKAKNTKNKDKDLLSYFTYQEKVEKEEEYDIENQFISKKKKILKPPTKYDKRKISFQRQKDKKIIEFPLFEDNLIFKDINRSYLQDIYFDDGEESSEEIIRNGIETLSGEIEQAIDEFLKNLNKNQKKPLLSRRMKFKNEKKNE